MFRCWRFFILAWITGTIAGGTVAAEADSPPLVILVSIDGCRWDYPELHGATFLREVAARGTRVERLVPSYPTKTFPNHYSIVTGLRPQTHGIIQNKFFDPDFEAWFGIGAHPAAREGRWWGGEPIWLTAQRQGLRSACLFWPGSEADILGEHPGEWLRYDGRIPENDRVDRVLGWLERPAAERPHFVTLYFEAVDSAGHEHGPDHSETGDALLKVDTALARLWDGLERLGLQDEAHLILTADHGMTYSDPQHTVILDTLVDPATVQVIFAGASAGLAVKQKEEVPDIVAAIDGHPHLSAWAREDVPSRLHFSANSRIPDIVVMPDRGWQLSSRTWVERNPYPGFGDHGYDPAEPDMGALFIGVGPRFAPGTVLPPTDNIHVYHLLCALLGVAPAENEGDDRLVDALRP